MFKNLMYILYGTAGFIFVYKLFSPFQCKYNNIRLIIVNKLKLIGTYENDIKESKLKLDSNKKGRNYKTETISINLDKSFHTSRDKRPILELEDNSECLDYSYIVPEVDLNIGRVLRTKKSRKTAKIKGRLTIKNYSAFNDGSINESHFAD